MEQIKLELQVRESKGSQKMKLLRKADIIPAVVYGGGETGANVQVPRNVFERILRQHAGESVLFNVQLMQGGKAVADFPAVIKDQQYDPVSDRVVHLDFLRISLDKELAIKVPVVLKGAAVGLKKPGATLEHLLRELEVVCLPKDIPSHIEIDITDLDIHHSIHVNDLKLAEGVRTKVDPEAVIVTMVYATRELETPKAEEGAAAPELEVIKEKPKDAAAASGAAPAAGGAKPAAEAKK
jgi:large subunit ribosomal protein L25